MAIFIKYQRITPEQWLSLDYDSLILTGLNTANVEMGDGANTLRVDSSAVTSKADATAVNLSKIYAGGGNDVVKILKTSRHSSGVDSSQIYLGDGDDYVKSSRGVSFNDYYRSLIDCGAGNDSVIAGIPADSRFFGGEGKDEIIFKGKRSSWDLEFSFDNTSGITLTTSDNNKVSGFEVLVFEDVRLDLTGALLDGSMLPLRGIAPALNSSTDPSGKVWTVLAFDRLTLAGISGAMVGMGDGDNTLKIDSRGTTPAIYNSEVYSGAGNDTVTILNAGNSGVYKSKILLGDGNDYAESARDASGNYDFDHSLVDCGAGDDSVDAGISSQSTFVGGPGIDMITFEGVAEDWSVQFMRDSAGQSYLAVGTNKVYGFQTIRFQTDDPVSPSYQDVNGRKDAPDPLAAWRNKQTIAGPVDSIVMPLSLRLRASESGSKLIGDSLADTLLGGAEADVLIGGQGPDTMTGRGSKDLFLLNYHDWNEGDQITDFNPSQDRILLTRFPGIAAVEADLANPSQRAGVLVTADNDQAALNAASRFVYSRSSGNLYFNANNIDPGLGSGGGLIAQFPVGLDLNGQHLLVSEEMFPI